MATTIVLKHYGKVVQGVKRYYRPELLADNLAELEGKEFEEVLKEKTKHVSTDAHAFYRAGIIGTAMKDEMFGGWTKDEVHDHFAGLFLSYADKEKAINGEGKTVMIDVLKIKSTSSLNSKQMFEFCEKVIRWLAFHKIIVKDPEQYQLTKYR